jgi:hypothetical protein
VEVRLDQQVPPDPAGVLQDHLVRLDPLVILGLLVLRARLELQVQLAPQEPVESLDPLVKLAPQEPVELLDPLVKLAPLGQVAKLGQLALQEQQGQLDPQVKADLPDLRELLALLVILEKQVLLGLLGLWPQE